MNTFRSALVSMARDYAEIFRDRNLDDDLLRYLVGTIYGMRGPLYASMAMGILVTAAAWAIEQGLEVDWLSSLRMSVISASGPPAKPIRQPVMA